MKRSIKDGAIKLAGSERKPIKLGLKARKKHRQRGTVMNCGAEPVERILANVNGDGTMALIRQPVGQPSISRAKIQNRPCPATVRRHRRQNLSLDIFVRSSSNLPLPGIAFRMVPIRKRQIKLRVIAASTFRFSYPFVIVEEIREIPFALRRQGEPDTLLLNHDREALTAF